MQPSSQTMVPIFLFKKPIHFYGLWKLGKSRTRPVSWQQQSCPSDLLKSAQCAKSWESIGKYDKVCQKLRSMLKVWENVLIAIFAVQMHYFCSTNAIIFAVQMLLFLQYKCYYFCSTSYISFAVQMIFFGVQYKFFGMQYKSLLHFSRGDGL